MRQADKDTWRRPRSTLLKQTAANRFHGRGVGCSYYDVMVSFSINTVRY